MTLAWLTFHISCKETLPQVVNFPRLHYNLILLSFCAEVCLTSTWMSRGCHSGMRTTQLSGLLCPYLELYSFLRGLGCVHLRLVWIWTTAMKKGSLVYKYWMLMRGTVENYCPRGEIQPCLLFTEARSLVERLNFTEGTIIFYHSPNLKKTVDAVCFIHPIHRLF